MSTDFEVEHEPTFDRFVAIKLRVGQNDSGIWFPAGTRGVIVDVYDDGTYGIEFSYPIQDVLIVKQADLEPA